MFRALFVMDLDGTLVGGDDAALPDANVRALRRANEAGVAVAIATGRRRSGFRRERDRLDGIAFRVSLSNGAVLLLEDNERAARIHEIPRAGVLELARLRAPGVRKLIAIAAPGEEPAAGEPPDAVLCLPDGRWMTSHSPWDASTLREIDPASALDRPIVHAALHVDSRELAESLEEQAGEAFAGMDVEVHSVRSPRSGGALVEVVVAGGKGRTVVDLAEELGIPREATAAIGDDMNDARLLDAAAFRYAVGGSVLAARRSDATVTGTCNEGAVADALGRFLRELGD
jgi:hydroxymethylpyrimidine pyrophosphatase-like HAD family hydrolase